MPSAAGEVAVKVIVSVAPGQRPVSLLPGRRRVISVLDAPSTFQSEPLHPPTAWVDALIGAPTMMPKPGGAVIVARRARVDGAVFVTVMVYDIELLGFTYDGDEPAVKASPSAATAPEASRRQPRAATQKSRALLAATRHHPERAAAQRLAVAALCRLPEPRPDQPPVRARCQPPGAAEVPPPGLQLQARCCG